MRLQLIYLAGLILLLSGISIGACGGKKGDAEEKTGPWQKDTLVIDTSIAKGRLQIVYHPERRYTGRDSSELILIFIDSLGDKRWEEKRIACVDCQIPAHIWVKGDSSSSRSCFYYEMNDSTFAFAVKNLATREKWSFVYEVKKDELVKQLENKGVGAGVLFPAKQKLMQIRGLSYNRQEPIDDYYIVDLLPLKTNDSIIRKPVFQKVYMTKPNHKKLNCPYLPVVSEQLAKKLLLPEGINPQIQSNLFLYFERLMNDMRPIQDSVMQDTTLQDSLLVPLLGEWVGVYQDSCSRLTIRSDSMFQLEYGSYKKRYNFSLSNDSTMHIANIEDSIHIHLYESQLLGFEQVPFKYRDSTDLLFSIRFSKIRD